MYLIYDSAFKRVHGEQKVEELRGEQRFKLVHWEQKIEVEWEREREIERDNKDRTDWRATWFIRLGVQFPKIKTSKTKIQLNSYVFYFFR